MVIPIENPIQNAPSVYMVIPVDFVKHLSFQGKDSEVPFTPYPTKN